MSQHRSLKGASTITAKRNVLKRFERVELLRKRGQFKDGDKVTVTVRPLRDGGLGGLYVGILLPDGRTLGSAAKS